MISIVNRWRGTCVLALPLLCSATAIAQAPPPTAELDVGAPVVETNPAVRAALELPRESASDHFQAVIWLIDLDRPELAKPILEELTELQLTDAQRAALVVEFGSRDMLRLARAKELAPAGTAFADACMTAAAAAANDPQRIATLVAQLNDSSLEVRTMARNDLAAIGQPAAVVLLETLASSHGEEANSLKTAISSMGTFAAGPLLAMSATNDPMLSVTIHDLLIEMRIPQALPLVTIPFVVDSPQWAVGKWGLFAEPQVRDWIGQLPTPEVAERLLLNAIRRYQSGTPPFVADDQNQIELWHWDDATKKLTSIRYAADEATTIWTARLALELVRLREANRDYQVQGIVLGLESLAIQKSRMPELAPSNAERDRLWPPASVHLKRMLDRAEGTLLSAALDYAIKHDYAHSAESIAGFLGERGNPRILVTSDAQPSPLANALGHPNRRVRFAALQAIMQLDPASPYPGSSRVPDALAWFAGSNGERRAVVAMPTLAASTNLAGMMATHGLDTEATNRGRDAVNLARDMADLEMIFVDMDIQAPGIRQVIYELRISATTGEVPIALLAAEGRLEAAEQLATEHQRVIAVSRPHSHDVLARVVEQLVKMAGRDPVPPDERAAQAAEAAAWLNQLVATRPFYTIRRTAHSEP